MLAGSSLQMRVSKDTRSLQGYLGHRNIQSTTVYTGFRPIVSVAGKPSDQPIDSISAIVTLPLAARRIEASNSNRHASDAALTQVRAMAYLT
jgi:hypothetical protein